MREISLDEVATAAGVNKINNVPNYTWAACELASQESKQALQPLLKQLHKRCVYIMKRLPVIAKRVLDGRRKTKWNAQPQLVHEDIEQYPYFIYHVVELFEQFVDKQATLCHQKCVDEFLDTRTIYWHLSENDQQKLAFPSDSDDKSAVINLSRSVFTKLRDTISYNIQVTFHPSEFVFFFGNFNFLYAQCLRQLKWYNFFLVPLQTALWNEVQEAVNVLSEEDLQQKFEVVATKKRLEKKIAALKENVSNLEVQEQLLLKASTLYSHPVISV